MTSPLPAVAPLAAHDARGAEAPRAVRSTCPYCGVGCGVLIEHDGQTVTGVKGDPEHPANFGKLCTKGSTLHLSLGQPNRLTHPQLRRTRSQTRQQVSWDEALQYAAERFAQTIEVHGPDAVGFYISGQLLTEDYYVFNKLAKGLIGTNNVDTNSRLCMSSAVAAYKQTLGADAPPCAYADFDHATCILIAGANPAFAHPIAFRRIEAARARAPETRLIVVDPRRTDTAASADLHLAIEPGSDIWLFNALLHVMIVEHMIDREFIAAHTENFAALERHVLGIPVAEAARVCAVSLDDVLLAARWFGGAQRPLSLWCQGLNQSHHGTHNGTALIALSLALGKIGQPGCGPFSLTGQPNAMGGREVGGLSNLLPAHRDLANPEHRAEIAAFWGVPTLPAAPGLAAVEMFDAAARGDLKALWIVCTNPAQSLPQQARVEQALQQCDFVIVQEAYQSTETARYADLLLPASTWAEKEGCVTNSERCITHVQAAVPAPGQARADWRIACDFALQLGALLQKPHATRMFSYPHPSDIFDEHVVTTAGRDLDITALTYAVLDAQGPIQWPATDRLKPGAALGTTRLYSDHQFATDNRRARFVIPTDSLTAEPVDAHFPLRLTSGRLRDQWHGMSRTGNVAQLMNHGGDPRIDLSPQDMQALHLRGGDLVRISSRRGEIVLPAAMAPELRPGQAFIAMHWGRNVLNSAGANALMSGVVDPYSKQPELKHAAIAVEPAALPYRVILMGSSAGAGNPGEQALAKANALKPWLAQFGFASVSVAGRDVPSVILDLAHHQPISGAVTAELDALFGLDGARCLSYTDVQRGIDKKALIDADRLRAVRLSGDLVAAPWLRELVVEQLPISELRRWIFASLSQPPTQFASRGTIVCNCLNVSLSEIRAVLAQGADLASLQQQLRCGTSCGSCLPELRRLLSLSSITSSRSLEAAAL